MTDQPKHLGRKILSVAQWLLKPLRHILNWFYKGGLTRILLGVVLLLEIQRNFIGDRWPPFDVPRRFISWFLGNAVFQAILVPLLLLASYGLIYWFRIRKQRYIVVAEFRIWGKLTDKFTDTGMAARLRDELMRLWNEMRAPKSGQLPETARATAHSRTASDISESKPPLFTEGGLSLPETHVTLQYEGISVEAVNTFIRRISKREVVITGDLMDDSGGLLLAARTADGGPWEVRVENPDSLEFGLRRLSLRILTTLAQGFLPKEANTFVFLQFKARELEEDELVVRLAELGLDATPDEHKEQARKNIAIAYNKRGIWLGEKDRHPEAIREFETAIEWFPDFADAYDNLAIGFEAIGEKQKAEDALKKAEGIKQRLEKLEGNP